LVSLLFLSEAGRRFYLIRHYNLWSALKSAFDELVCLIVLVLMLSPLTFYRHVAYDSGDVIQLELVGSFALDGGTMILLKNSGPSAAEVTDVSIDGFSFSIQPPLKIMPGEISYLILQTDVSQAKHIIIFLADGSFSKVI